MGIQMVPLLFMPLVGIIVFIVGLLVVYDLGIGQFFIVVIVLVGANIFLLGALKDLLGVATSQ